VLFRSDRSMKHDTAETFGAKRVDRSGSATHEAYSEAKVIAEDAVHEAKKIADDFISTRPYTALFGAFALGFIYAKIR